MEIPERKIPEDCPVRDILKQTELVLRLLAEVLKHCEKCMEERAK